MSEVMTHFSPEEKQLAQRPTDAQRETRYVVLTMDELRLLIPQHQVRTLEPGFDVQYPDAAGPGWIEAAGARAPVYCLSADLLPLRDYRRADAGSAVSRPICVLLESDGDPFGVLCNQVAMFEQADPDIRPIPACMQAADMPLRGLLLDREQVLCVSSAERLRACLGANREPLGAAGLVQQPDGDAR